MEPSEPRVTVGYSARPSLPGAFFGVLCGPSKVLKGLSFPFLEIEEAGSSLKHHIPFVAATFVASYKTSPILVWPLPTYGSRRGIGTWYLLLKGN